MISRISNYMRLFMTHGFLKPFLLISGFGILLFSAGCSVASTRKSPIEDTSYLTPIPEATLFAYHRGDSIDTKLQAVMVARVELSSPPHFKPVGIPKVLFVTKTKRSVAYQIVASPAGSAYHETDVWLVIFESDIQVIPPVKSTPYPPFHGCSFVILDAIGGFGGEVGSVDCAKFVRSTPDNR